MSGENNVGHYGESVRVVGNGIRAASPVHKVVTIQRLRRNGCSAAISVPATTRHGTATDGVDCYRETVDGKIGNQRTVGSYAEGEGIVSDGVASRQPIDEMVVHFRYGRDGDKGVDIVCAATGNAAQKAVA